MMDPKKASRVETDDDDGGDEKDELELKKVDEAAEEVEEVDHGEEGETYRLYMVGRDEARECDARRARNALLTCDRPGVEVKYTIKFQEYSPSVLGLEFRSGRDYYIISTSTGTLEGLDQLQGGVCETLRMKVVLHVGQDPGRSPRREEEEEEGEGAGEEGEGPGVGATDWGPPWDKGRGRAARPELGDAALSGETHHAGVTESFPERRHSLLSGSGLALIVGAASGILIIFLLVLLALVACRLRRQRHHHQQQQQHHHPHHHHQQQQQQHQQQQQQHHQLHNSNNISSSGMPSNNYQPLQQHHLLQQQQQHHHHQQQHQQQQHHQLSRSISISTDAMMTRRDYAHARTLLSTPVGAPPPLGPSPRPAGVYYRV
ncbi:uncharacterized protein LOC144950130 [Lampetra fluviatilis]